VIVVQPVHTATACRGHPPHHDHWLSSPAARAPSWRSTYGSTCLRRSARP